MRPPITQELKVSWGIFGGTLVVCLIFLALWWDWGDTAEAAEREATAYRQRQAALDLAEQLRLQRHHNQVLNEHIEALKDQTGMRAVQPFMAPEQMRPGQYFQFLVSKIREDLDNMAQDRGVNDYDPELGFGFLQGRNPEAARVGQWLSMLQLTSKAVYLALRSPRNSLSGIQIDDLGSEFRAVEQGPVARPALLNEYRFTMRVTGSLSDILWLQHQLVAEVPTKVQKEMQVWLNGEGGVTQKVYASAQNLRGVSPPGVDPDQKVSPLVLRGLAIESPNTVDQEAVEPLVATFYLAGMDFLEGEGRGPAPLAQPVIAPSGGQRRAGMSMP